ncbi:MAG: serine O-acetyltransferase [Saprospiraceae bacterium]|jgi:serine O-acetyltransferase
MANKDFLDKLYSDHIECCKFPSEQKIRLFLNDLLGTLFPEMTDQVFLNRSRFGLHFANLKETFYELIYAKPNNEAERVENNSNIFFDSLPAIYEILLSDAKAMYDGDPAAESVEEVMRTYPGFYAIAAYRIANQLFNQNIKVIPRAIAEIAHTKTGIDIHPGATIASSFCIDHGTGIVIGATSNIGKNVKIYQGVTLGALSVNKADAKIKRHPTLEDNVVVYAGATILGGETVVGAGSIIGGNVWLTRSLPKKSTVYYKTKMNSDNEDQTDILMHKVAM